MRMFGLTVMIVLLLPLWLCILVIKLALVISDVIFEFIDRRLLP